MLIVGLGNPGPEYVGTRHNVGWEVIDRLAERFGWVRPGDSFNRVAKNKFSGLMLDGPVNGPESSKKVVLLKPMTFMNLSGNSVQPALAFYQWPATSAMVVLDDLALSSGRIRLRSGGSSGGHNGLKDIERALSTNEYPRCRIGIDPAPERVPTKDYVLGRFSAEQRVKIDPAIDRAAEAIACWIESGITTAMNRFNAAAEV